MESGYVYSNSSSAAYQLCYTGQATKYFAPQFPHLSNRDDDNSNNNNNK